MSDSEKSIAKFLNDPNVNKKIDYLFVGQGTMEAEGPLGARCVALHQALLNHNIKHEYYVGGTRRPRLGHMASPALLPLSAEPVAEAVTN